MRTPWNHKRTRAAALIVAAVAVAALAAAPFLVRECDVCEAASDIFLSGYVPGVCTIAVTEDAQAIDLPLGAPGSQRIRVGSVLQNCNGRRTYTITVSSRNCAAAPAGAKLLNDEDTASALPYSVEFNNPTTGGSDAVVTGLLASACSNQIGRYVNFTRIQNESSTVYVNLVGAADLAAGTYEDVVTISIYAM